MDAPRAGTILLAVVAAGFVAGLAVGLFHYVATEPVIERAIRNIPDFPKAGIHMPHGKSNALGQRGALV